MNREGEFRESEGAHEAENGKIEGSLTILCLI